MKNLSQLALYGGSPVRKNPYQEYNPILAEDIARASTVLSSGNLSGFTGRAGPRFEGGPEVRALEQTISNFFGVDYCITVNSATSGLHIALLAAGIGPGDEVVVPNVSMSATAASVLMVGAKPVFVDIEPDFFCIDCDKLSNVINANTRAILAVNLFGQTAELKKLRAICDQYNLILIEDNAQAPGAIHEGKFCGAFGDLSVLSFNIHKVINCGEGGAVLTSNSSFAERLKLLRNHGESVIDDLGLQSALPNFFGYNFRLTELQASVLLGQFNRLTAYNTIRCDLAKILTDYLASIEGVKPPLIRGEGSHVFYLYPMIFDKRLWKVELDWLVAALKAEGIHASKYVNPLSHMKPFGGHKCAQCPGKERVDVCQLENSCRLMYSELIVTNICRQPNSEREMIEFRDAVLKIRNYLDKQ